MLLPLIIRVVLIVLLVLAAYPGVGVLVYLIDVSRDWCGYTDFSRNDMLGYMAWWPIRLLAGDALCD